MAMKNHENKMGLRVWKPPGRQQVQCERSRRNHSLHRRILNFKNLNVR